MNRNIFRPSSQALQPFWETVTYFVKVPPGTTPLVNGVTLYRAFREEIGKSVRQDPVTASKALSWVLFQSDLDNAGLVAAPKVGDVIQDQAGVRWVIEELPEFGLRGNEWSVKTLAEV